MRNKIQFMELSDILMESGLTINSLNHLTGVSRNTLTSMRDGGEVSINSVTKLLNKLDEKEVLDVRAYRIAAQRKLAVQNQQKMAMNAGPVLVHLDAKRSSSRIAADLRAQLKSCSELALELAEASSNGDREVDPADPRNIKRYQTSLNANLDEIFLQLLNKPKPSNSETNG